MLGEAERQDGTVNVRTRDELVRANAQNTALLESSVLQSVLSLLAAAPTLSAMLRLLVQRHGMHRLEDVIKNLKEERDSRSQRSVYGAESSVGKGEKKERSSKGASLKDGKAHAKQKQQPNSDSNSKPQQKQQQQQPSSDAKPVSNGNANGKAADVDSAVAQSVAEKLVL